MRRTDSVYEVEVERSADRIWAAGGGLVSWDRDTGESIVYTMNDGLPANSVGNPTVAGDGTVWVGTRGFGAAWLGEDGRWRAAPHADGPLDDILDMGVDHQGDLWFGTGDGASRYGLDGQWTHYKAYPAQTEVAGTVTHMAFDSLGNRWFGTYYEGLSVLRADGSWHTYRPDDGSGVPSDVFLDLAVDAEDRLWAISLDRDEEDWPRRVDVREPRGGWSRFDSTVLSADAAVVAVAFDAANRPWFSTTVGLYAPNQDDGWDRVGAADGMATDHPFGLQFDERGELWAGSANGLSRRAPDGGWRVYRRGGLPSGSVNGLAFGTDGTAWLATGGGLAGLRQDGSWVNYTTEHGLFRDLVIAVEADEHGGVWFSTGNYGDDEDNGGVHYLDAAGEIASYAIRDGLLSAQVRDIALDSLGNVFFANDTYYYAPGERRDGGLSVRGADGTWTWHNRNNGLPRGGDPQALLVDGSDMLWIGTDVITGAPFESLARRFPDGRLELVPLPISSADIDVYGLAEDADGGLWIGTLGGGVLVLDLQAETWTTKRDDSQLDFRASALAVDGAGGVWFAAAPGVRARHADGTWELIAAPDDGLGETSVADIAVAPDGSMWFAGRSGGVSILKPRETGP